MIEFIETLYLYLTTTFGLQLMLTITANIRSNVNIYKINVLWFEVKLINGSFALKLFPDQNISLMQLHWDF